MIRSTFERTTAWLCLVVALLTGVVPAQSLVLCIESDGCIRVEVKAPDGSCATCDDHDSIESGSLNLASQSEVPDCPCVDIVFPGAEGALRLLSRPSEAQFDLCVAPLPSACLQRPVLFVDAAVEAPTVVPRPPDSLALIRTVVLLV